MEGAVAVPCACSLERRIETALPEKYRKAKLRDFPDETETLAVRSLTPSARTGFSSPAR